MAETKHGPVMAIVLAIIAGGIIPALFGFFGKVYDNRAHPTSHFNLKTASEIYNVMVDLQNASGAPKVLLLKAHDSGGPIPNKSSVVAEVRTGEVAPVFADWQAQPLDMAYIKMLEELIASKKKLLVPEDMDEGILKNVYVSSGFVLSDIRYIGGGKDRIYYLSIPFREDPKLGPVYENEVRVAVEKIKKLLRSVGATQ